MILITKFFHIARFRIWDVVLVFTVELVQIFVTINRGTSGSHHYYLLLENPVSVSSSIEGRVSLIIMRFATEKIGISIVIRSLELSVASNLLRECVCTLSTCVHYSSDLAKVRVLISYSVVRCRIQLSIISS